MNKNLKVIIVDDADYKRDRIKKYISEILPDVQIEEIECAKDFFCWLREQRLDNLDAENIAKDTLLFLDWNFPFYKNERIEIGMGDEVLRYMEARDIKIPTIIVSSDDVGTDNKNVLGTIKDDSSVYQTPQYEELIKKYMEVIGYEC